MVADGLANDHARQLLDQILSTPEFRQADLEDQWDAFFRHLFGNVHLGGIKTGGVAFSVEAGLFLAGLGVAIYLIIKLAPFWKIIASDVRADKTAELVFNRPAPAGLLAEAENKALKSEFRGAVRDIYLAALLELDNHRLIAYAVTKTNYEYLREIRRKAAGSEARFQAMVDLFEYKWYGLEGCSREDFQKSRELYMALLQDGPHG